MGVFSDQKDYLKIVTTFFIEETPMILNWDFQMTTLCIQADQGAAKLSRGQKSKPGQSFNKKIEVGVCLGTHFFQTTSFNLPHFCSPQAPWMHSISFESPN